jgi:CRISPR-associated protein Cas5d
MTSRQATVEVKVWGEYALFTRPDFSVERVSYLVMTPSAARGVLEAIFWQPEFRYEVQRIGVLKLGTQVTLLRNELSSRQGDNPVIVEQVRQQRMSLVLKDVAYRIQADMVLRPWVTDPIYKYSDQFRRRVENGRCFHRPYLGTREFAASFGPPTPDDIPDPGLNLDLGLILLDIAYVQDATRPEMAFIRHGPDGPRTVEGYAHALFFPAHIEAGWLTVPRERYEELRRLEGEHV